MRTALTLVLVGVLLTLPMAALCLVVAAFMT